MCCGVHVDDLSLSGGGGSLVEEWRWVGGNDGLLSFIGVVVYRGRPGGVLGNLGGERV